MNMKFIRITLLNNFICYFKNYIFTYMILLQKPRFCFSTEVTKSYLDARSVYLTRKDHINAHFFICFIALIIARIVEIKLTNKYAIKKILKSLRSVSCSHMDTNHYLFDYVDDVTDDINDAFNLDIVQKIMTLGEIKKVFAMAKKR